MVLVEGEPALYVERGGKSILVWGADDAAHEAAAKALVRSDVGAPTGRATLTKVNGRPLTEHEPIAGALHAAGFLATPRGLRSPRTG